MNLGHEQLNLVLGLGIIIGTIQCFFGYRLFKIVLGLTGFLFGAVLAANIGYAMSQKEVVALLSGLVGGFIGAALLVGLYFVGVFLIGALLGAVVGAALFATAGSNPEPVVLLILGVIGGVVACIFQKFMIIVSTAFVGAWSVVLGIAHFVTGTIDPTNAEGLFRAGGTQLWIMLLCWMALGIVGVLVQYKSAPAKKTQSLPSAVPDGEK
jgi:hypothetical protein